MAIVGGDVNSSIVEDRLENIRFIMAIRASPPAEENYQSAKNVLVGSMK